MFRFFARILGGKAGPTTAAARPRPRTRLGVEELMPRVMLNAGPAGLTAGQVCSQHAQVATTSDTSTSASSSTSLTGDPCAGGATLVAPLTDASGATGQASFNATTGSLKVQVTGAAASTTLSVLVNGTSVGSLTTNASGNGQANLSNVSAQAGATITVGDLQGTFAQVKFTAALTGTSGATGNADYNSVKNQLLVSITGAAASTTYNVTVNGTDVGQITTNSSGAGKLKVSPSAVTIEASSTIAIADTAGDAAILQGVFA